MKKNLRIVSAAAAALLAVAPVAASAVNVNADVIYNDNKPADNNSSIAATKVNLTVNLGDINGKTVDQIKSQATVTAAVSGVSGVSVQKVNASQIKIYAGSTELTDGTAKLEKGKEYTVEVSNLKINGLINSTSYSAQSGSFSGNGVTNGAATGTDLGNGVTYKDSIFIPDGKKGTPIFTQNGKLVTKGTATLTGTTATVADLVNQIDGKYTVAMSHSNATATTFQITQDEVKTAITNALAAADVKVDSTHNNTFAVPNADFVVTLTGRASNGKTVSLPITVKVPNHGSAAVASDAPVISLKSEYKNDYTGSKDNFSRSLALNSTVTANDIAKNFTAKINGNSNVNAQVNVDSTNLNTAVAGKYTVVLSATNNENKTSKVTVNVTVGHPGDMKTVQAGSDTAKVVTINGNNVTQTNTPLTNGSSVATFGETTVNGVSYTKLNGPDSNQYVETKYVDGSIKEETTKSAKVMYKSAVYDKDGKSTGKTIGGYTDKDFVTTSNGDLKVVEIKGGNFYQLAKGEGYVRVRNVTGSKMTLKHNAYVYKSNGKRANKKVYKKGSTVTVYGGQYKAIKKYKGKAVRIGVNRYIKTANVNYKLDK